MLKSIRNGGDVSAVILEHLGDVYYKLDAKQNAVETWEKAKKIGEGTKFLDKKITDQMLYE